MIVKVDLDKGNGSLITTSSNVSTYVNIRASYSTNSNVMGKLRKGDFLPLKDSKGFHAYDDGSQKWYEVETLNGETGFVSSNYSKQTVPLKEPTEAETQALANDIIENDKRIYQNILILSATIDQLQRSGINVATQAARVRDLNEKLAVRQAALKNSKWFGSVKKSTSTIWDKVKNAYNSIAAQISGVGAIPLVVAAIVAGVSLIVGAGGAVAVYYCLKPKYDESKTDLKASEDLKQALATLGEDKATAVMQDLEKQIDDAYNQGLTDGTFGGFFSAIKPLVIGALGFILITKFVNSQKGK